MSTPYIIHLYKFNFNSQSRNNVQISQDNLNVFNDYLTGKSKYSKLTLSKHYRLYITNYKLLFIPAENWSGFSNYQNSTEINKSHPYELPAQMIKDLDLMDPKIRITLKTGLKIIF